MIELLKIHALVRMARVMVFIGHMADFVRWHAGKLARGRLRRRRAWMPVTRLTGGVGSDEGTSYLDLPGRSPEGAPPRARKPECRRSSIYERKDEMRFWFSGPRIFSGLVRPGVSFGPEDMRAHRVPATARDIARKAVKQLAKENGEEVPDNATIDAWLEAEVERQRRVRPSIASVAWFIFKCIIAIPLAVIAIGGFWLAAMLLQQIH
jgi:hypothetical protein